MPHPASASASDGPPASTRRIPIASASSHTSAPAVGLTRVTQRGIQTPISLLLLLILGPILHARTAPAPPEVPADHAARFARGTTTFTGSVRPLLTRHCLECHRSGQAKGGLDLTSRESLLLGGDDGPVLVPFHASRSRLPALLRHDQEPHMPAKAPRLAESDIERIADWINDGAPYDAPLAPTSAEPADGNAPRTSAPRSTWWAFQPLAPPAPPRVRDTRWPANSIDRFILAGLESAGVDPAPEANRRTLIRRASLGLLGIPPTPDEVEAFLADPAPEAEAWRGLVGRLLARPEFGERWARHWLDVARFAESSGFEHDYDRPGAYHYRDFVIRAFNDDLPYDTFVRWQLAGDEFEPDLPAALMATGFLGAGVFPTQITANEVERTRYDALDDMLATTGSAFLGLTLGCARCHDHKSDPITSRDYYRLLATFTTTTRSELELDLDPATHRAAMARHEHDHAPLVEALRRHETTVLPARFQAWLAAGAPVPTDAPGWRLPDFSGTPPVSTGGATLRPLPDGSFLAEGKNPDSDRYTFTTLIDREPVAAIRLEALADTSLTRGGPGRADNGNFALSRIRVFTNSPSATGTPAGPTNELTLRNARASFEQNNGGLSVASSLDDNPRSGWAVDPRFGTNHAAAFELAAPIVPAPHAAVRLTIVLEFEVNTRHQIGRPRISLAPQSSPPLDGTSLPYTVAAALAGLRSASGPDTLSAADRAAVFDWWKASDPDWRRLAAEVENHARKAPTPQRSKVLACVEGYTPVRMHTQGADFFPETHFLRRGSPDQKQGVATQGFPGILNTAPDAEHHWDWKPPAGARFSGRRRALAEWMTDTRHGAGHLLARVMVNRLWQHHFGSGLVATPNDFGVQGARPSNPGLLDWLASELIRHEWHLKPIHELILTSATYRQTAPTAATSQVDAPSNPPVLRGFPARRLEAEAVRDSMLAVCGVLDRRQFGPGTLDDASTRRSIYFTLKRSRMVPSMQVFDAPEPLVSQGTRPATTVAPQALLLLNSPHVRTWAARFALRLAPNPDTSPATAVARAYALALGRPPTAAEHETATAFIESQSRLHSGSNTSPDQARHLALTDFAQAVLGLNEFIHVE